jgi:DNA-binding NarL/FixJ family response regulator
MTCSPPYGSFAGGDALLAPSVTKRLMAEFAQRPATPPATAPVSTEQLTPREIEVWAAVARGLSNGEIANTLFMSYATAKTHISRLLTKLGARDRAQLVILAYESGVVSPGAPT